MYQNKEGNNFLSTARQLKKPPPNHLSSSTPQKSSMFIYSLPKIVQVGLHPSLQNTKQEVKSPPPLAGCFGTLQKRATFIQLQYILMP